MVKVNIEQHVVHSLYFEFYRLELNREPLNCPVDRNILIRDKVGDLLRPRVNVKLERG